MPMTPFRWKEAHFSIQPSREALTPKTKSGLIVKPFGACHSKQNTGSNQETPSSPAAYPHRCKFAIPSPSSQIFFCFSTTRHHFLFLFLGCSFPSLVPFIQTLYTPRFHNSFLRKPSLSRLQPLLQVRQHRPNIFSWWTTSFSHQRLVNSPYVSLQFSSSCFQSVGLQALSLSST